MGYEGWSKSRLWSELGNIQEQLRKANAKRDRLDKAWKALKNPKSSCGEVKKAFQSSAFIDNCGEWKGYLKDDFVKDMAELGREAREAWDKMDDFHDEINRELYKAKLASGRYMPIVSEIKGIIQKFS